MPITRHVRERVIASAPACRLIKTAGRQSLAAAERTLRLLRLAWYTTPLLLDADEALTQIAERVEGLDVERVLADMHDDEVDETYRADRAEARSPSPVALAVRRTARSDGPEHYTAPTLVLSAAEGRTAVVPGFQPLKAAEVTLMNLEPRLQRLLPPEPAELLRTYPGGLTSQEVARMLADTTIAPDRAAAEVALTALTALAANGRARRRPLADDALWIAA
jgi:hypothetical protein